MSMYCEEKKKYLLKGKRYSDGDGGAREKKERKTKAGVVGQHQERLVGERIVRGGSTKCVYTCLCACVRACVRVRVCVHVDVEAL